MPLTTSTIQGETGAYRRGVVLGLTMAEVILLVVFTLLLAFAAMLIASENEQEEQLDDFRRQLDTVDELRIVAEARALAAETQLAVAKAEGIPAAVAAIEDDWERIGAAVAANAVLEARGVRVADLATDPRVVLQAQAMTDQGFTVEQQVEALGQLPIATAAIPGDQGIHSWPPIITLEEARGYYFETSSARLSEEFVDLLSAQAVPRILRIMDKFDVDVIEVVGHTDERPVSGSITNLDQQILEVLRGNAQVDNLVPADNAGLGLARAVAVATELMNDPRLIGRTVIPMSAAQLVDVTGLLTAGDAAGDIPERRRIEIRIRRSVVPTAL